MKPESDPRFFALLVHRGLLSMEDMRAAVAAGDPHAYLLDEGLVTEEQWDEWVRTEAGTRPELTRYELDKVLGEGGTARVFSAVDRKSGDRVALKVLKSQLAAEPESVQAFIKESRILIDLDHPHIVKGLRVAREGEVFFCAMEQIEGVCLQDDLGDDQRLDEEVALRVVMQVV